jgi:hypothetical protein
MPCHATANQPSAPDMCQGIDGARRSTQTQGRALTCRRYKGSRHTHQLQHECQTDRGAVYQGAVGRALCHRQCTLRMCHLHLTPGPLLPRRGEWQYIFITLLHIPYVFQTFLDAPVTTRTKCRILQIRVTCGTICARHKVMGTRERLLLFQKQGMLFAPPPPFRVSLHEMYVMKIQNDLSCLSVCAHDSTPKSVCIREKLDFDVMPLTSTVTPHFLYCLQQIIPTWRAN